MTNTMTQNLASGMHIDHNPELHPTGANDNSQNVLSMDQDCTLHGSRMIVRGPRTASAPSDSGAQSANQRQTPCREQIENWWILRSERGVILRRSLSTVPKRWRNRCN